MELVMAHERALGARVQDVHTAELSLHAGLNTPHPGFDVLSPSGRRLAAMHRNQVPRAAREHLHHHERMGDYGEPARGILALRSV